MADIFQTTFSNAFAWMKMFQLRLKFHWSLFLRVQWTIFQHWFRWWLGAVQATSHYLNQWLLVYLRIYASLGLNELGWTVYFPLMTSDLVQMLNKSCIAICNYLLFLSSFNNLNLIFIYYSSKASWCVISETIIVAVNGSLHRYCLYCFRVNFGCFMTSSVVHVKLVPVLTWCKPSSQLLTGVLLTVSDYNMCFISLR